MGLFGKKKDKDVTDLPEVAEIDDELDVDTDAGEGAAQPEGGRYDRAQHGPFDASEKESGELLDLGGLRVEGFDGMELRLELNQETGEVIGVTAVAGESQMQVHPYAAPRTAGVWNDIRMELAENVRAGGGAADAVDGPIGTHLDVQLPQPLPGGGSALVPMRFYGVDGPRWFVRGLLVGPAVEDELARTQLEEWFRGIVVMRGDTPMAPRTPLPLKLPQEIQQPAGNVVDPIATETDPEAVDDLNPFERGPEITEIR